MELVNLYFLGCRLQPIHGEEAMGKKNQKLLVVAAIIGEAGMTWRALS